MKEKTSEREDAVLRKMLNTPHKPNVPKRAAKKVSRKTSKTKKPAK